MPWRTCKPMDERLRFIARLLEGEKMAPLCREFGISRVTGYKLFERYKSCGLDGLHDALDQVVGRREHLADPWRRARGLDDEVGALADLDADRDDRRGGAGSRLGLGDATDLQCDAELVH